MRMNRCPQKSHTIGAISIQRMAALDVDITPRKTNAPALAEMVPEVYENLRRLAASYLRGERSEHTLQRTALVHEAYLRLADQHKEVDWQDRAHFLAIFARVMRQTLTNYAVARRRKKRGGNDPLERALEFYDRRKIDVTALDATLRDLEALDPRQAQIVELRFFGGLTVTEIASAIGISPATVKREWATAKLWLRAELSRNG
jgi:RNA polymerase sigma-70 factor, ECF subfamily